MRVVPRRAMHPDEIVDAAGRRHGAAVERAQAETAVGLAQEFARLAVVPAGRALGRGEGDGSGALHGGVPGR